MNNEKITISMDDVNRATPVPGSTPPPFFTPAYTPPESEPAEKPKRTGLKIGIAIAVVAVLAVAGIGVAVVLSNGKNDDSQIVSVHRRTVQEYRAEQIREIERELANPSSTLRRFIEDAHVTVTVTSTSIVRCDVSTFDGTNLAGKDDANIDKVTFLIRFNWQGIVDTGYSDLRLVYDVHNDRLLESKIDFTTALINTQDPDFWFGVGEIIGAALL